MECGCHDAPFQVPPALWRAGFILAKPLFPGANAAMGTRMKDMTFRFDARGAGLLLASKSLQALVR
jgi:hypothetical protein